MSARTGRHTPAGTPTHPAGWGQTGTSPGRPASEQARPDSQEHQRAQPERLKQDVRPHRSSGSMLGRANHPANTRSAISSAPGNVGGRANHPSNARFRRFCGNSTSQAAPGSDILQDHRRRRRSKPAGVEQSGAHRTPAGARESLWPYREWERLYAGLLQAHRPPPGTQEETSVRASRPG